ncbi:hypothetical protein A2U01_0005937 [Trifolium medium]|uniref:Uncharacterized protein n=2 Tax=Trifolium TaxID=3898 RepID=A0A2K3KUT4_TRIPR|nr:hypothetical protein [Trifolium medium]PNX70042.1 hypothetical protein L195_g064700 [Trifolium pratense]
MVVITNPNNRNWSSSPVQIVSVVVVIVSVVVGDVVHLSRQAAIRSDRSLMAAVKAIFVTG